MECKQILTSSKDVASWRVSFDRAKTELFVPEFCIYIFAVEYGEINFLQNGENVKGIANTLTCFPPLSTAKQVKFNASTVVTMYKIDAWYFLIHFFVLPNIKILNVKYNSIKTAMKCIQYLQEQKLSPINPQQIALVRKNLNPGDRTLSDKQINRYLKAWFGLTLSQLRKIYEFELFIKHDCKFGEEKTTLINNVDYDAFYDYSHFGHTFKTMTGMNPQIYLANEGTVQSLFW